MLKTEGSISSSCVYKLWFHDQQDPFTYILDSLVICHILYDQVCTNVIVSHILANQVPAIKQVDIWRQALFLKPLYFGLKDIEL